MPQPPRKFDSEIRIEPNGDWIFRGNTIDQKDILTYFKQNLRESQNPPGVYIENQFGELSEHGFLEILGFPLFVTHVNILETEEDAELTADDGMVYSLLDFDLYHNEDEEIFCQKRKSQWIKFKFSKSALGNLIPYLEFHEEKEERKERNLLRIGNREFPIRLWLGTVKVALPSRFD